MIAGIVLAAGTSRRLGRPKQLLPLGGKPLLDWVLDAMRGAGLGRVVLVLGHDAEAIRSAANLEGVDVAFNARYAEGMSTSLQAGLAAMGPDVEGAVVATGDQPFIGAALIADLVAERQRTGKAMVATDYGAYQGPPMYLGREVWPLAAAIRGDQGARALLGSRPDLMGTIRVADPVPGLDVDTEEAYAEAVAFLKLIASPPTA